MDNKVHRVTADDLHVSGPVSVSFWKPFSWIFCHHIIFLHYLIGFVDTLTFIPNALLFFLFFFFFFHKLQTTKLNTIFLPVLFGHFVFKHFIPASWYFWSISSKGKIKCFTWVSARRRENIYIAMWLMTLKKWGLWCFKRSVRETSGRTIVASSKDMSHLP